MQEEVNQKTVALSIRTTKLTGKVLAAALGKVVRALQKHHRKALTPQGRQSVKKLMNHYGGKSAMPYVGAPKDFDRIAKEFHVDYASHKVSPGHYLLFFKANQADAITAAFQKYSAKVLNKGQDKASILGQLRKFTEQIRTQAKEKQRTRDRNRSSSILSSIWDGMPIQARNFLIPNRMVNAKSFVFINGWKNRSLSCVDSSFRILS